MSGDETKQDEASPTPEQATSATASAPPSSAEPKEARKKKSRGGVRIYLVPYPKFIFMYPTLIVSLVAAIVLFFAGHRAVDPDTDSLAVVMTGLFLIVLTFNTFIITFDFPRATSLTLVFVAISFLLGVWMLAIAKPDLLPTIGKVITTIRPVANSSFFACIAIGMMLLYAAIFIKVRFDYWELSNNELLHHHGILSDLKRFPAPNLRIDKEINDVFEYLLLGAGRLILHPSTEKRAIVLDNILFVSTKEKELTKALGSIKVKIGSDSSASH
jgi:hypothetical protein